MTGTKEGDHACFFGPLVQTTACHLLTSLLPTRFRKLSEHPPVYPTFHSPAWKWQIVLLRSSAGCLFFPSLLIYLLLPRWSVFELPSWKRLGLTRAQLLVFCPVVLARWALPRALDKTRITFLYPIYRTLETQGNYGKSEACSSAIVWFGGSESDQ